MTADVVVKVLAVVGGGVVGGLGLGLLAQLVTRAFTTQKLPRWPLRILRLLGAIIGGWLVALWLFGGGGPGIGGMGGWGLGSGPGKGDGQKTTEVAKKDGDDKRTGDAKKAQPDEMLRIEVLGRDAVKKADADAARWYRIDQGEGSRLLTYDEIKEAIKERQKRQPPLHRIEIVLYKDSPNQDVPLVKRLVDWIKDLGMQVDFSGPGANAPIK